MTVRPFILLSVLAALASGCSDIDSPKAPRTIVPRDPSAAISDGAHSSGNDDVFFLPPLVSNPNKAPGYGDPFATGMPVTFKIRDLTAAGTPVITTLSGPAVKEQGEMYQADWNTKASNLLVSHRYRIEVWIGPKTLAFADVIVGANGSELKNVDENQFIALVNGSTLPIKVRIEKGWNCLNNQSCTSTVVPTTIPEGQKVVVKSPDGKNQAAFTGSWYDPNEVANTPVVVTVEDVTTQKATESGACSMNKTKMNARGSYGLSPEYCIRIVTEPAVHLTEPVIVATCRAGVGDSRQLLMKYDVNETPKFLDEAVPPTPCPTGFSSNESTNPLVRLASRIFGVKSAYAIDLGVGGLMDRGDGFSVFTLGLPATMQASAGQGQTGGAGEPLAVRPRVRVIALHHPTPGHEGVTNGDVTCQIFGPLAGSLQVGATLVSSAPAVELPSNDGTYECPSWVLSSTPGANSLKVTSSRLDSLVYVDEDGETTTYPGQVYFNATGIRVVNSVSVTPTPVTLNALKQTTLTATVSVTGGAPQTVTWTSNNSLVATVDASGVVTTTGIGTATITATSTFDATKSGSATINVPNYADNFESALAWTPTNPSAFWNRSGLTGIQNAAFVDGLVNLAPGDASNGYLPTLLPAGGSFALWYGQGTTGSYIGTRANNVAPGGQSTVPNDGELRSPAFNIPAGATVVDFGFDTWFEIESVNPSGFDLMRVGVRDVATNVITLIGQLNPSVDPTSPADRSKIPFTSAGFNLPPQWKHIGIDIAPFAGKKVQLVFRFSTGDPLYNGYRGWVIDNVVVKVGTGATIFSSGRARTMGELGSEATGGSTLNPITGPGVRTPP